MIAAALLTALAGFVPQLQYAQLGQYFERAERFGLSGAVVVVEQDRIAFTRGFGYSDVAQQLPMTTATGIDIASLAKQVTAAAVLKLEEQGSLGRNDAISRFLRDVPADKNAITLEHLLLHQSGLPQFFMTGNDFQRVTRDSALAGILKAPLRFAPGTSAQYSDAGYTLLAIIVEQVSGRTFEDFVTRELFVPLRMMSTTFYGPASRDRRDLAHGYVDARDYGPPSHYVETPDYWALKGAGGVITTADDLARWEMGLFGGTVLQPQSAAALLAVRREDEGTQYSYYGSTFTLPSGKRALYRSGAQDYGFGSSVLRYQDPAVTVILVLNHQLEGMDIGLLRTRAMMNIDNVLFGDGRAAALPDPGRLAFDVAQQRAGRYQLSDGSIFEVSVDSLNLIVTPRGPLAVDLFAYDPPGRNARLARAQAARHMVNGICRGDAAPFRRALRDTAAAARYESYIRGIACEGSEPSFMVLGTLPRWWDDPPTTETATLISGNAGGRVRTFRIEWQADRVAALGGAAVGVPAMRFARGRAGMVGHHLGSGHTVHIHFEQNRMIVGQGRQTVAARRLR
jgi:CubicO group peptidase (beta-lactamase class C family)